MAKQMKTTEKVSPQTECPAGGTNPAPESLDAQLAELSAEISKAEQGSERLLAIIKQTPARIATAKGAYDRAFNAGDDVTMESARAEIRRANLDRDESAVKLGELAAPVEQLRDRQGALRAIALETWTAAQAEEQRARRVAREAVARLDVVSATGSKVSGLVGSLGLYTAPAASPPAAPVEAETPAKPAAEPAAGSYARKPACPRCLRADDVIQIELGKFTCTRPPHGRIIFGPDGQLVDDRGGRRG